MKVELSGLSAVNPETLGFLILYRDPDQLPAVIDDLHESFAEHWTLQDSQGQLCLLISLMARWTTSAEMGRKSHWSTPTFSCAAPRGEWLVFQSVWT